MEMCFGNSKMRKFAKEKYEDVFSYEKQDVHYIFCLLKPFIYINLFFIKSYLNINCFHNPFFFVIRYYCYFELFITPFLS